MSHLDRAILYMTAGYVMASMVQDIVKLIQRATT